MRGGFEPWFFQSLFIHDSNHLFLVFYTGMFVYSSFDRFCLQWCWMEREEGRGAERRGEGSRGKGMGGCLIHLVWMFFKGMGK